MQALQTKPTRALAASLRTRTAIDDGLDRGLERLQQLVDDILVTDAIDRGQLVSAPVDVEVGKVMDRALGPAIREARQRRISFHVRYEKSLRLHVDPSLAIAAVRKVVESAIRFTELGDVDIEVEDKGGTIAVNVSDVNPGPAVGLRFIVGRWPLKTQGWTITAECSLNQRCHICLTLPAARVSTPL